jgi:methyl-accepting chemotaxis protein
MDLGKFKISTKIFATIGMLGLVAAIIAVTGISALSTLNDIATEMKINGSEAMLGSRLNTNAVALNRTEYNLAADPSPETIADAKKYIEEQSGQFEERLAKLKETAGPNQTAMLAKIEEIYRNYKSALEGTMAVAERNSSLVETGDAQKEILASVQRSRGLASDLRDSVREYFTYSDDKSTTYAQQAEALYESQRTVMVAVAAVGLLLGIALGWFISQSGIVKPIRAIVACLKELAGGNLQVSVFGTGRKDEIGDIAQTTQVFKENMVEAERLRQEQAEAEKRQVVERKAMMTRMADDFESAVGGIVKSVAAASTELESAAQTMTSTAEETSRQSAAVAAATEQASANVQTVASASEELSSSVKEIARQVEKSSQISDRAVTEADRTNRQVQALAESAKKIGDVVDLINNIAAQTNLLALNATIEAARAGEAGKGFAVVASEVKTLATQTAKATEEIAGQIASIQSATGESVASIDGIGATIREMSQIASAIAAAMEEQGAATQEISRNAQQAAQGTQEVSSNVTGVNRAATDTGSAAAQVLSSSGELSRNAETLRGELEKFLTTVRAA